MNLKDKKVLFIGIGFYDYEDIIKNELLKQGAQKVDYFSSVYNSLSCRVFHRLGMDRKVSRIRTSFIEKRLLSLNVDYDYIFIIKAECFDESNFQILKNRYSSSKVIIYLWDSIERHSNSKILLKYFRNNIFTFDRVDAIKYNLKFRPLFFRTSKADDTNLLYDLSFVGWVHSDRYKLIKEMKYLCEKGNIRYKFVLFTGPWTYFLNRYIFRKIDKADGNLFHTTPLSYEEYINISKSSNVVLDISHPKQKGLTMRTIETLALGRKVLTTNADIENYEIINKMQYHILSRNNINIPKSFLCNSIDAGLEIDSSFSLLSFLDDLFSK